MRRQFIPYFQGDEVAPVLPPASAPTPEDIRAAQAARVQTILNAARSKQATLTQLTEGFLLAQGLKLDMTVKELGDYIVQMVQPNAPALEVRTGSPFANMLIGALGGFFIHLFVQAS
jgi:hypothetical protein